MTNTITMPRSVLEQALEHLTCAVDEPVREALRAALDQSQDHCEQYLDMVPVEATQSVDWPEVDRLLKTVKYLIGIAERGSGREMRNDETVEQFVLSYVQSLEQPQVEQEMVGEAGSMPGTDGFTMACFRASDVPVGTKLYIHPQPKREPLTDEQIIGAVYGDTLGFSYIEFARAIERAHGIG